MKNEAIFFLFLLKNIDRGVHVRTPALNEAVLTEYPRSMF